MQSTYILVKYIATLISFYTLSTPNLVSNSNINFNAFAGKKVLIVNTAINSPDTIQYRKLEQLYQKYKDSLVIIAFPSNDFGHTPMSDSAIKNFIQTEYNVHYLLAAKTNVKGTSMSPIYSWLADIAKNGAMNSTVNYDFYKYLIDKNGNLVGIFSTTEDPMGTTIRAAVEEIY
jgi:glutathione peroxidase